jgi:hypothetical protein
LVFAGLKASLTWILSGNSSRIESQRGLMVNQYQLSHFMSDLRKTTMKGNESNTLGYTNFYINLMESPTDRKGTEFNFKIKTYFKLTHINVSNF